MYLAEKTQIRVRHYNPQTGRFLSEDPIHFDGGDLNLYRYVSNNPTNFADPKGTVSPLSIAACFVAFGIGEIIDVYSNIQEQTRLQNEFERRIAELDAQKNQCSNSSEKYRIEQERQRLIQKFQNQSLGNVAGVFTPGAGGTVALAACLFSLATF